MEVTLSSRATAPAPDPLLVAAVDAVALHPGPLRPARVALVRRMALLDPETWTPAMTLAAWETCQSADAMLGPLGIAPGSIPRPAPAVGNPLAEARAVARELAQREHRAVVVDGHWELEVPGDRDFSRIFGSRAGATRCAPGRWRVPVDSGPEVASALLRHRFCLAPDDDPEVDRALAASADWQVAVDGDQLCLRFDYDRRTVAALKQAVPAARFVTGAWRVPIAESASVAELAGRLAWRVEPEAQAVLDQAAAEREWARVASRATDADIVVPDLSPGSELMPFQRAGVAYAAAKRRVLIADSAGLGKTSQALATLSVCGTWPAILVCKANLKLNWERELGRWLVGRTATLVEGQARAPIPAADLVIVNYDLLHHRIEDLLAVGARALVFDEGHLAKENAVAVRAGWDYLRLLAAWTEAGATGDRPAKPRGSWRTWGLMQLARALPDDAVVLDLTATPRPNRNRELWPQLGILGLQDAFGGWKRFATNFCDGHTEYGRFVADGSTNEARLHELLREKVMVRRRNVDVLAELPPVIHEPVILPLSPEGAREYREAEEDIVNYLAERAAEIALELGENPTRAAVRARMRALAAEHMVRLTTLRRLAATAKLPAVIRWIEDFLAESPTDDDGRIRKVVVFAHHREVQTALAEHFPGLWLRASGEQRPADAEADKARFQEDPDVRVIVCSPAAKEGHTLTAANHVVLVEQPWTWADVEQMYGRCFARLNDLHGALVWWLMGADTVDDRIHRLLQAKRRSGEATLDGMVGGHDDGSVMGELVVELAGAGGAWNDAIDDPDGDAPSPGDVTPGPYAGVNLTRADL